MKPIDRTRLVELGRGPLKFVTISGGGWLLDTAVYMALVTYGGMGVFLANIAGGVCGGSFTFLTSHRLVFAGSGKIRARLAIYVIYTAVLVVAASALVDLAAQEGRLTAEYLRIAIEWPTIAFLAKCLITPLLLATNFFVARALSRRRSWDE